MKHLSDEFLKIFFNPKNKNCVCTRYSYPWKEEIMLATMTEVYLLCK